MKKTLLCLVLAFTMVFGVTLSASAYTLPSGASAVDSSTYYTIPDDLYDAGVRFAATDEQVYVVTKTQIKTTYRPVGVAVTLNGNEIADCDWIFTKQDKYADKKVGGGSLSYTIEVGDKLSELPLGVTSFGDFYLTLDYEIPAPTPDPDPTPDPAPTPDPEPTDDGAIGDVNVLAVVPQRMSIRLYDGRVITNHQKFLVTTDQPVSFQMCSNNWETGIYNESNGVAGTVIYKMIVSKSIKAPSYDEDTHTFSIPTTDKTLRVDTNKAFMAYRYTFNGNSYDKKTGINGIVDNPMESLSVNLPLGAVIASDAYVNGELFASANVFVERDLDDAKSYTDFNWG